MGAPLKPGDRTGTTVQSFQGSQDAQLGEAATAVCFLWLTLYCVYRTLFPLFPLRRAPCLLESYSRWGVGQSQLPMFISTLEPGPFPGDLQCLISRRDRGVLCKSNLSWFVNLCQCSLSPPVKGKLEQHGDLGIGLVPPSPASHFDETILGWGWP